MTHDDDASAARLSEVLEAFCRQVEEGQDPDPAQVLAAHPDLEELAECLEGLALAEELRAELRPPDGDLAVPAASPGNYQILREVGRGGMGVVYEALDLRLNRRVALKMIKSGDLASPEDRQRFLAEAQHVAQLQHPNIVQIFEVGEQGGRPFLALEFVAGRSLAEQIRLAPLPVRQAAELVEVLARAMHFAHEQQIVHRDLKPGNILLAATRADRQESGFATPEATTSSSLATAKITDFGLAKRLDDATDLTHTGAVMGSPPYMAPEQAAGRLNEIGPVTDVYALGVILYETLTGRPPFRAATTMDTLRQVLHEEPVPPRRLQPLVPIDLQTICLKCLHKERGKRYPSALALAEDLARFLRGEPILARPVGAGGRLWRWCRRNPVVASLTAVAAALFLLVVGLAGLRLIDASAVRAREAGRREEILAGNRYAAEGVASTILLQFQQLAAAVDQTASDPRLVALMQQQDRAGLRRFFQETHAADPERGIVGPDGTSAFHTWHVLNREGKLLADVPPHGKVVVDVDFPGRDYFQGALLHAGEAGLARIHVSRAYQSENDRLFKMTLSTVVYAGAPDKKNVVGVVCATLPTSATLGSLRLNDERRTAVLVGRRDTRPPRGPAPAELPVEYLILVHPAYGELPAYGRGLLAEPMPLELLRVVPQLRPGGELQLTQRASAPDSLLHPTYEDPLGKRHPHYAGRWLAAFAPVGNTEMVVIVQQRDDSRIEASETAVVDWLLLLIALLTLAAFAVGWLLWRRQRGSKSLAGQGQNSPVASTITLGPQ